MQENSSKKRIKKVLSAAAAALMLFTSLNLPTPMHAEDGGATLTVDLSDSASTGDIIHGAAGFLFGVSSEDVPTTNTIVPLKSKILVTKTAVGTEHPYGDVLDVAKTFLESGGTQVQMYNNTYYGVFGATATMDEYCSDLINYICPAVVAWKNAWNEEHGTPENPKDNLGATIDIDEAIVYVPINEGCPGGFDFALSWRKYYEAIKSVDPGASFAGPNSFYYNMAFTEGQDMKSYIQYCADYNCVPDVITWHELETTCLRDMSEHIDLFEKVWNETDWTKYNEANGTKGIPEIPQICFNEYAEMAYCGVPGRLVNWISRIEDEKVTGCLPFWHQANNLNDLASGANSGNGAWWLYKWYGDMSGTTRPVESTTEYDLLYGVSTVDSAKALSTTLFGGYSGDITVNLKNLDKTTSFKKEKLVHVTVEETMFTGFHGALDEPTTILDGTFKVESDGSVNVKIPNALFENAYKLTVSLAADGETEGNVTVTERGDVYEAENAKLKIPAARTDAKTFPEYYMSNDHTSGEGSFFTAVDMPTNAGITYTVEIKEDGLYRLDFVYGNGQGTNRGNMELNNPVNVIQSFSLDGGEAVDIAMESTLWQTMTGIKPIYYELTKGTHTVEIVSGAGIEPGMVTHDFVRVTRIEDAKFEKTYEAEKSDFNTLAGLKESSVIAKTEIPGYSGSSYVTGLSDKLVSEGGGIRYTVVVPESGLYDLSLRYNASEAGYSNIYVGNTATTLDRICATVSLDASSEWNTANATVFLQKGINILDLDASVDAAVDYVKISEGDYENLSAVIEAEDCIPLNMKGKVKVEESDGASCGKYVAGIAGDHVNPNYLEFKYNAAKAGKYALTVYHSNEDIAGTHWYNIKVIDKYAIFEVNGESDSPVFAVNKAKEDPRTLYYFADCGDHDPSTLSEGETLGKLNSVTDRIYGKDKSGYNWGVVIMRDDEHEDAPRDKDDKAVYTNYQRAMANSKEDRRDGQAKQDSFRYSHGQFEAGIDRYVTYRFELDPGIYDVDVGMSNALYNCNKATVILSAGGVENQSQDYKLTDGYKGTKTFVIDLTNAEKNANGKVELTVTGTTEESCVLMSYVKIFGHIDSDGSDEGILMPGGKYVLDDTKDIPDGVYVGELEDGVIWTIDMRNLKNETDRYFFKNSYSDDTFEEKTIILDFKEGENVVRIYNDNSWNVTYGGTNWTPGTEWLENYTPNFDKFVITPISVGEQEVVLYESTPQYNNGSSGAGVIMIIAAAAVILVGAAVFAVVKFGKKKQTEKQ